MHTRALSTCHFFILSYFKGVWCFLRDLSIVPFWNLLFEYLKKQSQHWFPKAGF